jgi:photolyase PhrII
MVLTESDLPDHLAERVRPTAGRPFRESGDFILYWMRTAVRAHENPALDTALVAGDLLDLPVFIYHGLSERYPFASDRHHRFILEGARDVQVELRERGVGYAFHLERPGHRGPHLRHLAGRAALVVTEEMPVRPLRQWTEKLAAGTSTPVWPVDTACVVPMRLAGKAHDRAFAYRRATEKMHHDRLSSEWPENRGRHTPFVPDLPFEPLDLQSADLAALVAECEIDHAVGPVLHTVGGSAGGYERWELFKSLGLARYARDRNDPLRDGVSRMSPYLHYGHVSPFRLAREAAALPGDGPRKFLDELLVWRELAYTYCFFRDDHDSPATLPTWARESLAAHESDQRPAIYSWETLARAKTGDALWDAAQRSLLVNGELHNNVRMTWGKALPSWTPKAGRALDLLVDLNHRYALDGRDPSSYGGILWCLGRFDRPFKPETPILGTVRPRSTKQHARRLDVDRYSKRVSLPKTGPRRVAVIGAGMSGLTCARTLADHGHEVVVFDKGSRPGGRISTRTTGGLAYDHGAQYFTARDPRFKKYVEAWDADGLVAEWDARFISLEGDVRTPVSKKDRRYVGVPEMNSVMAHLASDLDVLRGVRVGAIRRSGREWLVETPSSEEGPFDFVILAVPAPQAVPLLKAAPSLQKQAAAVRMSGCWAVLLAFPSPLETGFDGAFVNGAPLSWVARNGSKPSRRSETWVLHASPDWTRANLEADPDRVAEQLVDAFAAVARTELPEPIDRQAHRWRFALPDEALPTSCLFDERLAIAVCGDWCGGPRVEGAFLSGSAAAGRVLGSVARNTETAQGQLF